MGNFIYWTEPYAIPIETIDWVFDVLDFTTGISLLLGLISIYIFHTQSPPNMLTFSRVLIVYQVVALANDVMLGTGLAPYFTFPCPGGVPTGWLKRFGLSSFAQLIIGCALLGHSSGLIMIMFVVRQQYILPIGHPFKMKLRTKVILYLLLQILPYCHSILGLLYMEKFNDLSITRHYYFAKYPALRNFIAHPGFYSLLPDDAFMIACHMLFWAAVGMVLVGGACLSCFHVLESSKSRVSAKTLASYRWIILKLAIQVCIPMFTLLIPGACAVFLFFLEDPNWISKKTTALLDRDKWGDGRSLLPPPFRCRGGKFWNIDAQN
ncbi:unnamed protein product, partial [Mesorhabditis spiculigera]